MSYMICIWLMVLVVGLIGVGSNPAPIYAALGLVMAAGAGCVVLAFFGMPFLALVLFLIYLGGMMVVFAYSTAMAADAYPETWGDSSVFDFVAVFVAAVVYGLVWFGPGWYNYGVRVFNSAKEFLVTHSETVGVIAMYSAGGLLLGLCVLVLLVTLIVVVEIVRLVKWASEWDSE
uniref:NADH-ubiquinone oxidoreductase chain 6 n=1 Tax=Dussumieria elopsoides TaxID=454028 RepID=A0A347YEE9_9TELE|nr:NADH dehydrogenase subunit 6 [Dussumieria elopsoides]